MLTHSHYCKACDRTWSCDLGLACIHDGHMVKSEFHCRPEKRVNPAQEAMKRQWAKEKREFIQAFNTRYRK
jgi:hypothetical protein